MPERAGRAIDQRVRRTRSPRIFVRAGRTRPDVPYANANGSLEMADESDTGWANP
jgi:hypothetical protein